MGHIELKKNCIPQHNDVCFLENSIPTSKYCYSLSLFIQGKGENRLKPDTRTLAIYLCINVCKFDVCLYVCMFVCMFVLCMYGCVHVCKHFLCVPDCLFCVCVRGLRLYPQLE